MNFNIVPGREAGNAFKYFAEAQFITQYGSEYGLIMAASVLSLIPVLAVFLIMQQYFIEGIASTGIKG